MKLIQTITDQLKEAAQAYVKNEIDLEEFEIRLDLLADQMRLIDIETDNRLMFQRDRCVALLNKSRSRCLVALNDLKHQAAGNKRVFNAKVRKLIETKLCFKSLYWSIRNSLYMHGVRNPEHEDPFDLHQQIFILTPKENSDNFTEGIEENIMTNNNPSFNFEALKSKNVRVEAPRYLEDLPDGTTVLRRYNGEQFGYLFSKGVAYVDPKDIDLFMKKFPQWEYSSQEEQK